MAAKKTSRKKRQTEIPGTERQVDEELSDAAERLHSIRTDRMELQTKEAGAQAELLELMRQRKMESYIDEDLELKVTVRHGEDKISVTKLKTPKAPADADE